MKRAPLFAATLLAPLTAHAASYVPDCTGAENYPAAMAHVQMKNADIMENEAFDFSKTRVSRLASEKIGHDKRYDDDIYRQVHEVTFTQKSGESLSAIVVSDATRTECSMGDADVYVVLRKLTK